MLNNDSGVTRCELGISSGYNWSDTTTLELYIDLDINLSDPGTLLTSSNDPSYITREVFIQEKTANAASSTYETFITKVQGAGLTITNYASSV